MDDPLARSASQFFATLFRPVRTPLRSADEDQLTAAVAACCQAVPGLAHHLASELFGTNLVDRAPAVEIQCPQDRIAYGAQYDLVLGASDRHPHRGGLVLEHKLESDFGGDEAPGEPGAEPRVRSQLEKYLEVTANWRPAPNVGAIVKREARARVVNAVPWGSHWAGCVTWTKLDATLRVFHDCSTSELARFMVTALRHHLRQKGAVMQRVPPTIHEPRQPADLLQDLLATALVDVSPWQPGRTVWQASGFYTYLVRDGIGANTAALQFRAPGVYLTIATQPHGPWDAATLVAAGWAAHPTWGGWYELPDPLPLDFSDSSITLAGQLAHAGDVLRAGLGHIPAIA